jgi:hypothetical protein
MWNYIYSRWHRPMGSRRRFKVQTVGSKSNVIDHNVRDMIMYRYSLRYKKWSIRHTQLSSTHLRNHHRSSEGQQRKIHFGFRCHSIKSAFIGSRFWGQWVQWFQMYLQKYLSPPHDITIVLISRSKVFSSVKENLILDTARRGPARMCCGISSYSSHQISFLSNVLLIFTSVFR